LLWYDGQDIDLPTLQVPHPRISERNFVLFPFKDIAPTLLLDEKHRNKSKRERRSLSEDNFRRIDLTGREIPRYIAVEGPIGAGKTTLTKYLAETFNYETVLERADENPFLERFYAKERNSALPTQLFFLFQRIQQLNDIRQADMFEPVRVADFLIEKDQLAPASTLLSRIEKRGIEAERSIDSNYLNKLNDAYTRFFHYYDKSPLLIVNAEDIDWVNNAGDYQNLVDYMLNISSGRHYYNPQPSIF